MGAVGLNIEFTEGKEIIAYENDVHYEYGSSPPDYKIKGDTYFCWGLIDDFEKRQWLRNLKNAKKFIEEDTIGHSHYHLSPNFTITVEWKKTFSYFLGGGEKPIDKLVCKYCEGDAHADLKICLFRLRIYKMPPVGAKDHRVECKEFPAYVYRIDGSIYCKKCGLRINV